MAEQIVSLAVLEALPGKEEELLSLLRELYTVMHAKGYCRDSLHRDSAQPSRFLHIRHWVSAEMRSEAQADPAGPSLLAALARTLHHPYRVREPGRGVQELNSKPWRPVSRGQSFE